MTQLSFRTRLMKMALRDPLKIPAMMRLKLGRRNAWLARYDYHPNCAIPPPLIVSIRPSYGCNLRCIMCPQWGERGAFKKRPDLARRTVKTEEVKRFIDDISGFRPYIYFSGGEPLLCPDIFELIRHASSRHLLTSINTNGSFLRGKEKQLIESGLDYLYTSLDAPCLEVNDKIRADAKGEGSYDDAIAGIAELVRLRDTIGVGLPIIQTKTVLVKENHQQLLEMARFAQDILGVDAWVLGLCVYTTPELDSLTTEVYSSEFGQGQVHWGGFINEFRDLDYGEIQRQCEIIAATKWKMAVRIERPFGMPGFDWKRYHENPELPAASSPMKCMNPYVFAQMQPNGDLAFCGSQPDYSFGNIRDSKFLEAWNGERANKWRRFLNRRLFPSCPRCWSLYEYSRFDSSKR